MLFRIPENLYVIAIGHRGIYSGNSPCRYDLLVNYFIKVMLSIVKQLFCLHSFYRIAEDGRIFPGELPCKEEECQVDIFCQRTDINILNQMESGLIRLLYCEALPAGNQTILSGCLKRDKISLIALSGTIFPQLTVFLRNGSYILIPVITLKRREHTCSPGSILYMDHRSGICRGDLNCSMDLRSGSPADKQRNSKLSPFHLSSHVDHLFERRGDKSAEAYEICVFLNCGINYLFRRDHYAEVGNLIIIA